MRYSRGRELPGAIHIPELPHPRKQGRYCCLTAASMAPAMRRENCGMAAALARREYYYGPCASQERRCVVRSCYGCCHSHASKERINVSAVLLAPPISFQPLSLCLGLSWVQQTVQTVWHRETIGIMNKIGKTWVFTPWEPGHFGKFW